MTHPEPADDRRSFASRTPANDNPDKVAYRRGFVTRHQVSGWRFVMRRIASGVALHDTRMLVDPLRTQFRAVAIGVLIFLTGLAGCFVLSLIRPNGSVGNNTVLADRSTAALYVRVGEQLHPVLNLTSARLIAGRPDNPTTVKSSDLNKFPRGSLIGIPGAPERMVQSSAKDANWTVCDGVAGSAAGVTVIAGQTDSSGTRAAHLGAGQAVLVDSGAGAWLLWDGKRSAINLGDHAVTNALGWADETPVPRPIAPGLLNAIPEAPALSAPIISGAGAPPQFGFSAPVGAVVVAFGSEGTTLHYAVLPDGLQAISPVLAAVLRNTDSYGLQQPPRLGADDIARLPVSRMLDNARYPGQRISLVNAAHDPVTCAQWNKAAGATASSLTLLSGAALPVPDAVRTVELVGTGAGGTATRVALAPGAGYFTQTVGNDAALAVAGSLFWVTDTGVRYGIDDTADAAGHVKTVEALGLNPPPLPIPWSMLSLFAPGPTLSRADALLAHDSLPADPRPGRTTSQETR
jgi:type VII secretion protein EccB